MVLGRVGRDLCRGQKIASPEMALTRDTYLYRRRYGSAFLWRNHSGHMHGHTGLFRVRGRRGIHGYDWFLRICSNSFVDKIFFLVKGKPKCERKYPKYDRTKKHQDDAFPFNPCCNPSMVWKLTTVPL